MKCRNISRVQFIEIGNLSQYYQMQYLNAASPPVGVQNFIVETLWRKRQKAISIYLFIHLFINFILIWHKS